MTKPSLLELAEKLTEAQRQALLSAEWRGSGETQFAVVEGVANLPANIAHMLTLRWDRLTDLGVAVRAALRATEHPHD